MHDGNEECPVRQVKPLFVVGSGRHLKGCGTKLSTKGPEEAACEEQERPLQAEGKIKSPRLKKNLHTFVEQKGGQSPRLWNKRENGMSESTEVGEDQLIQIMKGL